MDPIIKLTKKYNLFVIEDAACALGATFKGKAAGSYGDVATFSFHARKNTTSGEGGIVVTNNQQLASKIEKMSCFGMESAFTRQHKFSIPSFTMLGFNYKLSDINAAIAIEQIRKYPELLKKRKDLVETYNRFLINSPYIRIPIVPNGFEHVYQTYAVSIDERINRNQLILDLRKSGIQTQIATYASHIQPVYRCSDRCENSKYLYDHLLALPLYYELTIKEVEYITNQLHQLVKLQINKNEK